MAFHCLNRSAARLTLLEKDEDCVAFERVLEECVERVPLRVLDYLVMEGRVMEGRVMEGRVMEMVSETVYCIATRVDPFPARSRN